MVKPYPDKMSVRPIEDDVVVAAKDLAALRWFGANAAAKNALPSMPGNRSLAPVVTNSGRTVQLT